MPVAYPILLFLTSWLVIAVLAAASYAGSGRPEARFFLTTVCLAGFGFWSLVPLKLFSPPRPPRMYVSLVAWAESTPAVVVHSWTKLYGRDTIRAAKLTTKQFRGGEPVEQWGKRIHQALREIEYEHAGGEVIEEKTVGNTATVKLRCRIAAIDGISWQTEIYTLTYTDEQWLIDSLEVRDEIVPGGKNPYSF